MYNYRVRKDQWWDFARACREVYLNNHPLMQLLKSAADRGDDAMSSFKKLSKTVDALERAEMIVDIQIFDEGDTYILRPLERGYFFMNNVHEWSGFLDEVTYDDRADVPPEEEKNKVVAQWCDEKISSREYLMFNVLSRDDFMNVAVGVLLPAPRP
jgi:hypothetical protein